MGKVASVCKTRTRLRRARSLAAAEFFRAVRLLQERAGVVPQKEYEAIHTFVEKARASAEQASAALDKHLAEHDCFAAQDRGVSRETARSASVSGDDSRPPIAQKASGGA
jgi:glutathione S-transferase